MIPEIVETEVVIEAAHSPRTWHALLPNGKRIMAFVEEEAGAPILAPGTRVRVRLSVGDFSRGLVLVGAPDAA
jgi:hypothetical protein